MVGAHSAVMFGVVFCVAGLSCRRAYGIGDHVLVDWEPNSPPYAARIVAATTPAKYKMHFDGYEEIWDEVVPRERIRGYVVGPVTPPDPPAKVRTKATQAARTNLYKVGARVRVEWHGQVYPGDDHGNRWPGAIPR